MYLWETPSSAHPFYANAVGALTATSLGVIPALPTAVQVEEFLAAN
ncbi:MAG: hypothetical protein HY260_11565 [Chloroflexi bacterium]|nr:hypothetical protein [Chloroflexota bacterium]